VPKSRPRSPCPRVSTTSLLHERLAVCWLNSILIQKAILSALCFHGLTNCFSCNSFILIIICVAPRVAPFTPPNPSHLRVTGAPAANSSPNSFSCHTSEKRDCKPFRCHTSKKQGVPECTVSWRSLIHPGLEGPGSSSASYAQPACACAFDRPRMFAYESC
jgi:hypothetical protein